MEDAAITGASRLRAIQVADAAEAGLACRAAAALAARGWAGPLWLVSPPAAAGWLSPALFLALLRRGAAPCPTLPWRGVLDCGAAPGLGLAALRAGMPALVLARGPSFAALEAVAAEAGAMLWPERPPCLAVATLPPQESRAFERIQAWIAPESGPGVR